MKPKTRSQAAQLKSLDNISKLPLTAGNDADLLIDGQQTFAVILEAISKAEDYVLVQFYIMRDDELGRDLKDALVERASNGAKVYVLYDELGSKDLPADTMEELRAAEAQVSHSNRPTSLLSSTGNRNRPLLERLPQHAFRPAQPTDWKPTRFCFCSRSTVPSSIFGLLAPISFRMNC